MQKIDRPEREKTIGGFNPAHLSESTKFDGKRVRKAIQRRTVDYNSLLMRHLELRMFITENRDFIAAQPESSFVVNYPVPSALPWNPYSCTTTKHVHTSTNKVRCPVNTLRWTPEGRRLITGASSGEFTLWNGLTFNFETILQAHDTAIRCMRWSNNDAWMISGEDNGTIKYWQSNMNNLKMIQGHRETVRDLVFSPTDSKFASCSDDGTIKIWSFADAEEERTLTGHGWDVKCLAWHPTKGILASGSKDNLAKLWDPKTGKNLATLHGHKNTVMQTEWNKNGNWLVTCCRDQLVRVYDIRTMKEFQVFQGHQREVQSVSWHPIHEKLLVSGGWEGSVIFWQVGDNEPLAVMESAHESSVFALDWHPMGHILASGSNDHTTKFWTRNRPGDPMNDRFNVTKAEADALGVRAIDIDEDEKYGDMQALPGLANDRPVFGDLGDFDRKSGERSYSRGNNRPNSGGGGRPQGDWQGDRQGDRYGDRNRGNQDRNDRNDRNSSRDPRDRDSRGSRR